MGYYNAKHESPKRHENVIGVFQIYIYLSLEFQENYVDDVQLQHIPVDVSRLDLENGKSDADSLLFFKPLDKATLERIWPEMEIGEHWPGWYGLCSNNFTAATRVNHFSLEALDLEVEGKRRWKERCDKFGLEKVLECFNWNNPEKKKWWVVGTIHESTNKNIPHIGGRTVEIAEMYDDILLRSEILSIAALMTQKMTNRDMISQRYVPVYIISHAGMKVRILVAYFDDGRLKIQKSDIIEFGNGENMQGLKTIVSWTLCEAIGETEWKFPVKDPYRHGKIYKKKRTKRNAKTLQ